eukprot:gene18238-biopygen2395
MFPESLNRPRSVPDLPGMSEEDMCFPAFSFAPSTSRDNMQHEIRSDASAAVPPKRMEEWRRVHLGRVLSRFSHRWLSRAAYSPRSSRPRSGGGGSAQLWPSAAAVRTVCSDR